MKNIQNKPIEPIQEKLDDKIKALNSSRVYKKVTPRGDLSWYIKWASSVTLIIAMLFTSANLFPIDELRIIRSTKMDISCFTFLFNSGTLSISYKTSSILIFLKPLFL